MKGFSLDDMYKVFHATVERSLRSCLHANKYNILNKHNLSIIKAPLWFTHCVKNCRNHRVVVRLILN
jgi:hypothetical protein